MKLTKLLAAAATIAIVSEITRRIATEIDNRRMDAELAELFGNYEEDDFTMFNIPKKQPVFIDHAAEKRKRERQALLAEQDYELATLSHALSTQDETEITRSKSRLAEIQTELEALK